MSPRSIRPYGRFFPLDEDGYVLNDTSFDYLSQKWMPVMDQIVMRYRKELGAALHSIYLRGSLARGTAVEGVSDVDTFAFLTEEGYRWKEAAWQKALLRDLQVDFPFVLEMECMLNSHRPDLPEFHPSLCVVLKTQSLCLYGPDLGPHIPRYKPSEHMIIHARWLEEDLRNSRDVQSLMKGIIRSGFELVMERAGAYTTDLYWCVNCFSEYYPERAKEMNQALFWYLNPPEEEGRPATLLEEFGTWLVKELKSRTTL